MVYSSNSQNTSTFLFHLLSFCRKLKQEGIKVTLHQEIETCRSLEHIDLFNHIDFYHSLKANLVSRHQDMPIFDRIFFLYWDFIKKAHDEEKKQISIGKSKDESSDETSLFPEGKGSRETSFADWSAEDFAEDETKSKEAFMYSPAEKLRKKDFSLFCDEDLLEIKKAIALITQKISLWESHRKKPFNKASFFDFRRTIRKNIHYGGDFLQFLWKGRKITKTRILLLCDVSGSMETYSRFLIQFLYGFQKSLYSLETFVFSTRLSRITTILRKERFEKALEKISRTVLDWSGGTNIGACLGAFNSQYASRLLYRKTIVILISDGWDRGDEKLLRDEMKQLRKRAYYIIWLNPLLGSSQYKPMCVGMTTALPFLDQFLPLHNLDSLIKLGQAICRIS